MSLILGWLTSKIAGPVATALAVVFLGLFAWQTAQIDGWPVFGGGYKAQVAALTLQVTKAVNDLGKCGANVSTLQSSLDNQNAKIAALGKASAAAQAKADTALAEAKSARASTAAQVAAIQAAKPGADICKSADALILEKVK